MITLTTLKPPVMVVCAGSSVPLVGRDFMPIGVYPLPSVFVHSLGVVDNHVGMQLLSPPPSMGFQD